MVFIDMFFFSEVRLFVGEWVVVYVDVDWFQIGEGVVVFFFLGGQVDVFEVVFVDEFQWEGFEWQYWVVFKVEDFRVVFFLVYVELLLVSFLVLFVVVYCGEVVQVVKFLFYEFFVVYFFCGSCDFCVL